MRTSDYLCAQILKNMIANFQEKLQILYNAVLLPSHMFLATFVLTSNRIISYMPPSHDTQKKGGGMRMRLTISCNLQTVWLGDRFMFYGCFILAQPLNNTSFFPLSEHIHCTFLKLNAV